MKKTTLLLLFLTVTKFTTAQELEQFLVLGKDAGTMMQSYLQPAFEGTINNLNSGWYRTAKTHKVLGFDITLNATLATVPNSKKNFTFRNSDYEKISIKGNSSANATVDLPTAFGGNTNTTLVYEETVTYAGISETRKYEFDALDGITDEIGIDQVPAAMVQAGIGLPFNTDITLRFVPEVGSDTFKANLFGVGLKHQHSTIFTIGKTHSFS